MTSLASFLFVLSVAWSSRVSYAMLLRVRHR